MISIPTRVLSAAALTATLSLGLAACGSGDTGESAEQTLTIAPNSFPVTLDQHQMSAEAAVFSPMQHVLQPLVTRNAEDSTVIEPGIAESWETTSDTTWEFTLHEGAVFSDGTPVTSADVAASIDRVRELGGGVAPLIESISHMDTSDDGKLVIETAEPLGTLLNSLSLVLVGPADRIDDEDFWAAPVGSGPFTIEEFTPDQHLVLSRQDDWWADDGSVVLDEIVFRSMPEESSRLTALSNGEVDVVTGITSDSVDQVTAFDGIEFEQIPGLGYRKMWFNSSHEPFTDPEVRRALWHAVDVESIVTDLFGEQAMVAQAPIPQTAFGAPELEQYEYDPELAKQMLADAGYPDGFEATMQWTQGDGSVDEQLAAAFISAWDEIGVTISGQPKERSVFLEDFNSLNWDINLMGNSVASGDADYTLGRLYLCEAERNGYCNEELDEILMQAKSELDQEVREDLYHQASEIIWNDAVGIFPLDSYVAYAFNDDLENLVMDPASRNDYSTVTISESE